MFTQTPELGCRTNIIAMLIAGNSVKTNIRWDAQLRASHADDLATLAGAQTYIIYEIEPAQHHIQPSP